MLKQDLREGAERCSHGASLAPFLNPSVRPYLEGKQFSHLEPRARV
jgi:hypothetical protein